MDESIRKQVDGLMATGRMGASDLVLLFTKAYEVQFSGSLVVQSQSVRCALGFERGVPTGLKSSKQNRIVLAELSEVLPPEQLEFVKSHAQNHAIDELNALRRLHLLPDLTLRRVQQQCFLRALVEIGESASLVDYQFERQPADALPQEGLSVAMDPLLCIAELLGKCRDLSRYRQTIQSIRQDILRPVGAHLPNDLPTSTRQVLLTLRREAVTYETLRLRRVAPEEVLVASIWALLATGWLRSEPKAPASMKQVAPVSLPRRTEAPPTSRIPPASTVRPRAIQEVATNLQNVHVPVSHRPTNTSQAPPSSRGSDEMAIESATLDAWMRAVADASCTERALRVAERAGARFPQNPRILFYLGVLQAKSGLGEESEHTLRRVLKLDPEHTEAHKELMIIQRQNSTRSQTRPTALRDRIGARKSS